MFDLKALLATARVEAAIKTQNHAIKAQKALAEQRADEYARDLEKRQSLARALTCEGIDAMRFRFLGEHSQHIARLAGMTLDEMRKEVDLMIKREAIRRLSEIRRERV